ncbi:M56 family metallopeptidase [Roseisolibacter agri]|uniref:Uncharacterized protein n=1 Tax=Roseisolibacter agri TaxID=2014610 RepID=A0AA37Q052_9BACT|nr:M56 family metallopeptidase [Roseisolibacter agri]GLC24064.1 hypothetical protein rosag_05770 [Roseisolibacter agri]
MIALWMLLSTLLGALLATAALGIERALRLVGRPGRWAWATALALTVVLSAAQLLGPRTAPDAAPHGGGEVTLVLPAVPSGAAAVRGAADWRARDTVAAPAAWRALDLPLAILWIGASVVLLTRTAGTSRRLSLNLRRWPRETHGGTTVHVAPDLGPAVFGAVRPAVIVPRWALADARLPLMLAHEAAHVRARDPLLLAAGLAAALLMPWNLAAWWQLRRLRLAVELDCDARVLAGSAEGPAVRTYGALLLDVAHWSAGHAPGPLAALAPTLLATPSTLSRRIHAMTTPRPRRAVGRALTLAATATALVAAACELPRPTGPRAAPQAPLASVTAPVPATADVSPLTVADIRRAVASAFPGADTERRGATQRIWVVQDGSGRVSRVMRGLAAPSAPGTVALTRAELAQLRDGRFQVSPMAGDPRGTLAGVAADAIATIDVHKRGPGQITPDSTELIWIRLKGADVASATGTEPRFVPEREPTARIAVRDQPPARAGIALRGGTITIQPTDSARRAGVGPTTLSVGSPGDTTGPKPLYLIDGVEFSGAQSELPKPDRIESIEVLKGAAAEREYGARGGHGVIRITTKRE